MRGVVAEEEAILNSERNCYECFIRVVNFNSWLLSLDLFNTSAVFKFLQVDQMCACTIVEVINFFYH